MANQWNPDTIFDVLADRRSRQILLALDGTPRSAREISAACDGCLSSVYRRLTVLTDYDFLVERMQIDPNGNHYSVYEVDADRIEFELDGRSIRVDVDGSQYEEHWSQL